MSARRIKHVLLMIPFVALSGCGVGYLLHSARGQVDLMGRRVPIEQVVADPDTPGRLRQRLAMLQRARLFASERLALPAEKGYRSYADLERPFAVWSVVATPEFSLDPVEWCFPFAGCVSYRGYFSRDKAEAFARKQRARGRDVALRGVAAYSTLGYFDDPVLNTMMHWDDVRLVGIVFHELAHQLYYVKGDTAFNESFASVVEEQGLRVWLREEGDRGGMETFGKRQSDERCFQALLAGARARLTELYATGRDEAAMRRAKASELARLLRQYREAREAGSVSDAYDAWFVQPLNNAHIAAVGAYQQWVPALNRLFRESSGQFHLFYQAVGRLAVMSAEARERALSGLDPGAGSLGCFAPAAETSQ